MVWRAITTLCLLFFCGNAGRADFITQSGAISQANSVGPSPSNTFLTDYWNHGSVFSSASAGSSGGFVDLLGPGGGIHLQSRSFAPWEEGGFTLHSQSGLAAGEWLDVIRLSNSSSPGAIRIGVRVHGTAQVNLHGNNPNIFNNAANAHAWVGISNIEHPGLMQDEPRRAGQYGQVEQSPSTITVNSGGLNGTNTHNLNYNAINGEVNWTAYFDLEYDSQIDGYAFNLYASVATDALFGATSVANFGNTFSITTVTNSDGSAIAGPLFFESGYILPSGTNVVPAPPGVVLAGLGAITMLGWVRFRRRQRVAVA